jgi:hypothetical protein
MSRSAASSPGPYRTAEQVPVLLLANAIMSPLLAMGTGAALSTPAPAGTMRRGRRRREGEVGKTRCCPWLASWGTRELARPPS